MSESLVSVRGLSKVYKVYSSPWDRLLEGVLRRQRHRDFVALEEIALDLAPGEALGIIGENGAGKSTLMKILAGVTAATSGEVSIRGKVASILELGSGFHPEFSGRENIVLNAAMLGLSPGEVEAKTPEIIAFSELGDFIDQPVKVYSSGMAMRLGFAIATQVEPQVLIIDEALSVGDGYFQKKCVDRLVEFVDEGGSLIFCSHALYYVSAFCQRALWLKNGKIEALGPAGSVIRRYESFLLEKSQAASPEDRPEQETVLSPTRITEVRLKKGSSSKEASTFRYGEPLFLELTFESETKDQELHLGLGIDRLDGVQVAAFSTFHDGLAPFSGSTSYTLSLELPHLPLASGEFAIHVFLAGERALHVYDTKLVRPAFLLQGEEFEVGLTRIPHRWHTPDGETVPPAGLSDAGLISVRAPR